MNKIFKVVWSKTKECYVVVSEVAKNNSGKKKVLASVLAALAVVGAGATGTPVQAAQDLNKKVNISPTGTMAGGYSKDNSVSDNSVVVGYGNTTTGAAGNGHVAYGFGNTATEDSTTAIGGGNKATGGAATAVGSFNTASGRASVAIGNVSIASAEDSIAIGNRANSNPANTDRGSGQFSIAVGRESWAKGTDNISIGHKAETNSSGDSIAMGRESKANQANALAFGAEANASGWGSIATGREAAASANFATAIGYKANASGSNSISVGKENTAKAFDAVAIGHNNTSRTYSAVSLGTDNTSDATYGLTDAQVAALPYDPTNNATLTDPKKTDPRRGITSTIAIGRNNVAGNVETIAIGTNTKATMTDAIAIGARAEATGDYALAIGGAAGGYKVAAAEYGTAVGVRANAAERASAFGAGSNAGAQKSVAIGYTAKASAQKTTSNYEFSGSNGTPSPAGYDTETITVNSGSAPAGGAVAGNYYDAGSGVAIGNGATVSDESDQAVVVGAGAKTNGNAHYSVVLGSGSHADASDGFVAGHGSSVESRESIAMGSGAHVSGNENIRSQAIGYGATVSGAGAYDATAIGATAQVSGVQGGVALGSGSLLSRTTASNENIGWNSKYVDGTVVRNRAYTAAVNTLGDQWDAGAQIGAVSVGNEDQKRQIINVAAGSQDTDAVNVAQLKNVGVRVGADTNTATIGTNKVAADFLAYNGQLNIKGDNNRVTTVSENDANGKDANVNVKFDYDGLVKSKTGSAVTVDQKTDGNGKTYFEIDAAAGSKTVVADGKNTTVTGAGTTASPYKVNVEGALTGISSITNNGGGKIEFATGGTTISGGPVNVSNNKITGVANGDVNATSTDAVNGSQLHAVKAAERHIAPTTAGHEYTVDSNGNVTMTYLDGNNNAVTGEQAVIKGIAKNDLSNITNAGKKEITKLGTIVKAGDNVNVSESSDATTGRTTYTVNAVTPAVYTKADGTKVVKRPNGTFTTNLDGSAGNDVDKDDVITSFMDGNGNTTGGNMVINNVGSAIDKTGTSTGDTFLTKLNTAATNTPNAAVNVRDLKTTSDALVDKGLKFTGNNTGTENTHKLGSLVKVQGEGVAATDVPSFASAAGNIAVVANGTDTLELKLNKNLKGINSVSNGSSSITLNSNPGGTNNTPAVQITGGNLSMGDGTTNNKIVNLAPGTNDTDAVNYSQIKGLRTEVKQGANVTVSKTQGTDGHDIYTISAAATGGTASSWNIKSSADTANGGATATGHDANAVNISDQKTVEMVAGKNLTVKQGTTTDGAKVEFALSDKIGIGEKGQPGVAGKDGVDGKIGVNGKDGSSVVINGADGSIGMTGPQGKDGKDGINGRDGANISMTSAKGEQVLINRDPAHSADTDKAERIVYVPKDASGNPIQDGNGKNIVREVATMDDGLKFGGDMGTVGAVKLNKQVDVKGGITDVNKLATGNNIGVTSVPDATTGNTALNIQLAKDLTGLNSVELGGKTIKTDGDHITITSPDTTPGATPGATTTTKVANLADELHITPGTYEVGATDKDGNAKNDEVTLTYTDGNGAEKANTFAKIKGVAKSDLSNITNDGKKEITKLGTIVKAGDNVTVTSTSDGTTGRTTYTVNAVTPAVYTKADGTKVYKIVDPTTGAVTWNTSADGNGTPVNANEVIASFETPATGTTPGATTGGTMIVNNIGSAISGHEAKDTAGTVITSPTYLQRLETAAGDNLTKHAAVNVSDLNSAAKELKASELHIAPTAVKSGSTEVKGGVASGTENVYKYDATTKKVTLTYNDGNGKAVTDTKAVIDFSDLNIPAGGNNYGFKANATANGGKVANDAITPAAATAVENGGTVNFAAGKNLTVKQDIDATNKTQTYTFSLDKDLTNLDKIVVNGKDGQPGKDGVTIIGPQGATGTNGIDGKVGISGKDGKDAVSISGKDGVGHIGLTGPQGPAGTPGAPGTPGANIDISTDHGTQTLVKPEAHNNDKSERIVYVPKDANGNPLKDTDGNDIKREVATMDDGLRFTGNNTSKENKQPMNSLVKVQGEGVTENAAGKLEANGQEFKSAAGNIAVEADGGNTLTVKMNKDLNLTKDGSVTMGDTVVNNDGITIKAPTTPGTTTTDVKLTNQGLDNGGNKITNVAAGTANTDAVNVKQLKDNVTTVTSSDSSIKVVDKNVAGQPGYDANKGHQYDITINNQGVVNNAQTPVVYTKEDGTKVYKQPDGTFNTNIDGTGTVVPANQVIASMNSAGNSSTNPTKLQNVGSSIADKTGTTFLDKINTAAADPNAKYGAVNVTDLKSTADAIGEKGLNFGTQSTGTNSEIHKNLGEKLEIVGGGTKADGEYDASNIKTMTKDGKVVIALDKNIKADSVTVGEKGQPGAPGKDGKIGVNGADGSAVVINGKDGSIGLNGKDGANGITIKGDKGVDGVDGLNGTNGITRIVYQDKDGNNHEVATHDDGMKFAGDDGQTNQDTNPQVIKKHLNKVVDIIGGADKTKLTDNNIGVNNDGGKLRVQLIKDVNLTDTGSIKFGDTADNNTVINRGGITITTPAAVSTDPAITVSLTGNGLNNGGNKITNVKAGTDGTDAVNLDQLKAARTKVTSNDNSVTINRSENTTTGEITYDLHVDPNATPDLNRVNNRIDQLGEEVGRVGAQGAALSALKPIQYDPLEPTQIMAGYGNYRGNSAVALGVAHYKNESTLIHGGVSWAGGSSHMMANAGVTWKVGNRDSEAAVADRYRKGPISSAYAMQQEMAAMKAQNAGLKGEVSDLKAENEQMKAQIAAMMAKLGL